MGSIYSNGERVVKVFQKTPAWTSAAPEVKVQLFQQHLVSLKLKSTPAVEIIKPRSGANPFLKVTFLGDGEKREFTRYNKTSANKFEIRALTPMAAQEFERESKNSVKIKVSRYLMDKGFKVPDTDIGTHVMAYHRPEFHLQIRVFISSGLPGIKKGGKSHSFLVKLDNSDIIGQIETGMKDFQSNVPLSREEQLLQGVKSKTTRGATEPP